jgi:outer membrane protein insertion porin family
MTRPVQLGRLGIHCAVSCIFSIGASMSSAQAPEVKIHAIECMGLRTTSPAYVLDLARVQVGDPYDAAKLEECITRLLRSRRFLSARFSVSEVPEGMAVTFHLRERPVVTAIRFEGLSKFRPGQLKAVVDVKIGDAADGYAVRDGRDAIVAKYREAGYGQAVVTYDEALLEESGELVYRIQEGPRIRVTEISFEGRTAFSERLLKKQIETKTAIWIFRTGAFDADRAETDAGRLQSFYRDEGFLDARVMQRHEALDDGQSLRVLFQIEEGTRYTIEDVRFRGNALFSSEELGAPLRSQVGRPVRQEDLDFDSRAIQTRYGELGFIYATVRTIRVFSDTVGQVLITFEIREDAQYRVGRVTVRGNAHTKDKVVRRALNLYPPDDLFNLTEAQEAEKRLVETRVFSSARVTPVGDEPGIRDVVIDVTESERAGDLLFGIGVTSNSGIIGSIVLDLLNFDLYDLPRSWSEFRRFRSFTGAGQRMRIELQPGTELSRFGIDFTEPYLFDHPIRFDQGFFLFQRDRDGYEEERIGTSTSIGKRFERGRLRGWSGELALRIENVTVADVDLLASNEIRDDEGNNFVTGLKGTVVRDRTDNRLVPTTGDRFRTSYEQIGALGGDHVFGRFLSSYYWYHTMYTDPRERKHVLQLRTEGGVIAGDAPVFERFYAGGTGSLRGFEFRGVGPRDGLERNNVGGNSLILVGTEYSFPVFEDNLRGLVFVDSGTVEMGPWRASIGVGIRLTLSLFGPLPIELAVGFPFAKDDEDEEQVFSFIIGNL